MEKFILANISMVAVPKHTYAHGHQKIYRAFYGNNHKRKYGKASKYDVYIYRDKRATCKPCQDCTKMLKKIGFRRIIYCLDGRVVKTKTEQLASTHRCSLRLAMPILR
jgi:hypothetical protein